MSLFSLFFISCFGNHQLRTIQKFSSEHNIASLAEILESSKHAYLREEAIIEMSSFQERAWDQSAKDIVLQCTTSETERCNIRGYCAYTLGKIGEASAVEAIISAMEQCDSESRYWMLLGLEPLAAESSLARAQISALKQDIDIFIRVRAQNGPAK